MTELKLLSPHGFILQLLDAWLMLDLRLAELYEIEPDALRDAIGKNIDRFPSGSMFRLTSKEYNFLKKEFATLEREGQGQYSKYFNYSYPEKGAFAFTEHGLRILESVSDNPNEKNPYLIKQNVIKQSAIIKENDSIVLQLRVNEIFNSHNIDTSKLEWQVGSGSLFSHACDFAEILKHDLQTPPDKKETADFNALVKNGKQITNIEILCGSVPYIFKKDKAILNLFRKTIAEFYAERLSDFRRADDWYGFEDNIFDLARDCFEGFKTILEDESAVYRIMFDLFQLAGYPFTRDQIKRIKIKFH